MPVLIAGMVAMAMAVPRAGARHRPVCNVEPDGRVLVRWGGGSAMFSRRDMEWVGDALNAAVRVRGAELARGRLRVGSLGDRVWVGEMGAAGGWLWSQRWTPPEAVRFAEAMLGFVGLGDVGGRGIENVAKVVVDWAGD